MYTKSLSTQSILIIFYFWDQTSQKFNQVERKIPAKLLTESLHVNESKTEMYNIQRVVEDP